MSMQYGHSEAFLSRASENCFPEAEECSAWDFCLPDEVAAVAAQNTKEEADKHRLQGMLNNSLTSTTQLQQKVDLLVLERDGLQRLLASLSKEDAMGPKPGGENFNIPF